MQYFNARLFFVFLCAALPLVLKGQVAASPFSFGVGDLNNNGLAQNQGMGGIGLSNGNAWYINNVNPALLIYNRVTVFQAGVQLENRKAGDGLSSQSFFSGNLGYMALAFPVISGKWTTSLALLPYSNVNYNINYSSVVTGSPTTLEVQEKGTGGISQFYWANGVRLGKYFAAGIKAAYLFGAINIKDFNTLPIATNYTALQSRYSFNGLNFTGGFYFHKDSIFGKKHRLNIGLIVPLVYPTNYPFAKTIGVAHKVTTETVANTGQVIDSATLFNLSSRFRLPQSYGIGISYGSIDRWTVGTDFTVTDFQNYSGYEKLFPDYNIYQKINRAPTTGYRATMGFEITPRAEDFTNYLNRVTYRLGATYERFPFLVLGNPVNDIAGTFGFSLPVGRVSSVDIGCKIGKRGNAATNSFEENYFRVYFGITFNDQWFIKRKFD